MTSSAQVVKCLVVIVVIVVGSYFLLTNLEIGDAVKTQFIEEDENENKEDLGFQHTSNRGEPSRSPMPLPVTDVIPDEKANPLIAEHLHQRVQKANETDQDVPKTVAQDKIPKLCPVQAEFAFFEDLPKPEFCLIGVAKGGTTSLSNYLRNFQIFHQIKNNF